MIRNRPSDLDALFRPRSVAVIGASARQPSIGWQVTHNIVRHGFQGALYPVHPKLDHLHSIGCHRDVRDIPGDVDLAVIAVRAELVRSMVEGCAEKGVRGIIIISAGFGETGPDGAGEERAIRDLCREAGIRVVGPNCMGIINTEQAVSLNASFSSVGGRRGNVAFMSQSGALGEAILNYADELGLGLTMFASVGNRADVSANDLLEYWGADPDTGVILLYLESFGNPERFPDIARRVARDKAIIAVKAGGSESGRAAAASHPGSLAGREVANDALLRKGGVLRARTVSEMFHMARALSSQPVPRGRRVAVVTNAGGPGILAADALEALGLEMPTMPDEAKEKMRPHMLPASSLGNPTDLIAQAGAPHYTAALDAVLASDAFDMALSIFVPPIVTDREGVVRAIAESSQRARALGSETPVLAVLMGEEGIAGTDDLAEARIPVYRFPEEAAIAMAAMVDRGTWLAQPRVWLSELATAARARRDPAVGAELQAASGFLPGDRARALLADFGLPVMHATVVNDADEAVAQLARGSLVLKAEGPELVHKTELDAVRVDLRADAETRAAFEHLQTNVVDKLPGSRIVAQTFVRGGREVLAGATRERRFGSLIAFGAGGADVEAVRDVVFRCGPLSDIEARAMISEVRAYPALVSPRRGPPADIEAAVALLQSVSDLMTAYPEIHAVDLNPAILLPEGDGVALVDARVEVG